MGKLLLDLPAVEGVSRRWHPVCSLALTVPELQLSKVTAGVFTAFAMYCPSCSVVLFLAAMMLGCVNGYDVHNHLDYTAR